MSRMDDYARTSQLVLVTTDELPKPPPKGFAGLREFMLRSTKLPLVRERARKSPERVDIDNNVVQRGQCRNSNE